MTYTNVPKLKTIFFVSAICCLFVSALLFTDTIPYSICNGWNGEPGIQCDGPVYSGVWGAVVWGGFIAGFVAVVSGAAYLMSFLKPSNQKKRKR